MSKSHWLPPGDPLLPYGRGIQVPDIYQGTIEERFPLVALGDYTLEQRAAAPFPVVPLFEILGEPLPGSHETGNPSLTSIWRELSDREGLVPRSELGGLREWRAVYHERVERGLKRLRLLRERQRDILLALPGVRVTTVQTADSISTAASEVWAGLNMLMRRAFAEGVGDHDGIGGGVLAERSPLGAHSQVVTRAVLEALFDEFLDAERLLALRLPPDGMGRGSLTKALARAKKALAELQDEWLATFDETVEHDRRRQLYEIAVGYVVDGVSLKVERPEQPPSSAEMEYLERIVSVLLEHDRPVGELIKGATLKVYSDGRTGKAGPFVVRKGIGSMNNVFERVSRARGKDKTTAYNYFYNRFKGGRPPKALGFEAWTMELDVWQAFAGRFASGLLSRGDVSTSEYDGELRG